MSSYLTIGDLIGQDIVFMGSDWEDDPNPEDPDLVKEGPMKGEKYLGEKPYVNCNDLFVWGCADGEEITVETLTEFHKALSDCGGNLNTASDLYCARRRKMRPQGACYSHYNKKYWSLFDACGPEREVGLGNPHRPGEYKATNFCDDVIAKKWWKFWK